MFYNTNMHKGISSVARDVVWCQICTQKEEEKYAQFDWDVSALETSQGI